MKRLTVFFFFGLAATSFYACSDDDKTAAPVTPGTDSGVKSDAGPTGTDSGTVTDATAKTDSNVVADTGADAGVAAPCTDAELEAPGANYTGADAGGQGVGGADISFPTGGAPVQYSPRCVKIKVGQKVTFAGSFVSHPLESFGGQKPSPIPAFTNTNADGGPSGTLTITFANAGTFGFRCGVHTVAMTGAVKVVP